MEINGTICLYAVKQAWVAELRAETRLGGVRTEVALLSYRLGSLRL